MAGGYQDLPTDPFAQLRQQIDLFRRRLDELEKPSGTQIFNAVAKVQEALDNIGPLVDSYLASGFTTGSMTATGNVTVGGNVAAGGTVQGNVVKATTAPTTNITAARVAGWWQNSDGLAGTATSSERFKTNIRPVIDDPDFDDLAVIDLCASYWNYIDEVRKRDDPSFDGYVGPEYHVALNFSPIAERAHELGLWMIVVYERETDGTLRLDDAGAPIPLALHDSLFGYVLQLAVRRIRLEQLRDREDLHALAEHVGFALPSSPAGE